MDRIEPSRPPAGPHPKVVGGPGFLPADSAFRTEVVVAFVVGVLLIGGGVFVWRRPHTGGDSASSELGPMAAGSAASSPALGDGGTANVDAGPVALTEIRVLGCHDRGSRKTPPDQCDRIPAVEAALSNAIEQSASCVSSASSGGTIEYVASVSFRQHKVGVALPRSGRSFHDARTVDACANSVRAAIKSVSLDSVSHEHASYRLSVVATYRSAPTEGSADDARGRNVNGAYVPR